MNKQKQEQFLVQDENHRKFCRVFDKCAYIEGALFVETFLSRFAMYFYDLDRQTKTSFTGKEFINEREFLRIAQPTLSSLVEDIVIAYKNRKKEYFMDYEVCILFLADHKLTLLGHANNNTKSILLQIKGKEIKDNVWIRRSYS